MNTRRLYPYLTLSGAIPFLICAGLHLMGMEQIAYVGKTDVVLSTYGLLIASFMVGSQWGTHLMLKPEEPWAQRLPIFTNILAIMLWLGYLLMPIAGFYLFLSVCFLLILSVDYKLRQAGLIQHGYYLTRIKVTAIVVSSLLLSAFGVAVH